MGRMQKEAAKTVILEFWLAGMMVHIVIENDYDSYDNDMRLGYIYPSNLFLSIRKWHKIPSLKSVGLMDGLEEP